MGKELARGVVRVLRVMRVMRTLRSTQHRRRRSRRSRIRRQAGGCLSPPRNQGRQRLTRTPASPLGTQRRPSKRQRQSLHHDSRGRQLQRRRRPCSSENPVDPAQTFQSRRPWIPDPAQTFQPPPPPVEPKRSRRPWSPEAQTSKEEPREKRFRNAGGCMSPPPNAGGCMSPPPNGSRGRVLLLGAKLSSDPVAPYVAPSCARPAQTNYTRSTSTPCSQRACATVSIAQLRGQPRVDVYVLSLGLPHQRLGQYQLGCSELCRRRPLHQCPPCRLNAGLKTI